MDLILLGSVKDFEVIADDFEWEWSLSQLLVFKVIVDFDESG